MLRVLQALRVLWLATQVKQEPLRALRAPKDQFRVHPLAREVLVAQKARQAQLLGRKELTAR